MSHTTKQKSKLLGRVRRIKEHLGAIERALEAEIGCADVLMLVASVRGAVTGLTTELLEEHIRHHVVDPAHEKDTEKAKGAADLIDVVRSTSNDRAFPTASAKHRPCVAVRAQRNPAWSLHGLEPGHSKTMMAAFITAIRGTVLQATFLGLSATVSHTAVVWAVALSGL